MTLSEQQDKERKALEAEIKSIEISAGGWGDFSPEIAFTAEPLRQALLRLNADPKTYFENLDKEE